MVKKKKEKITTAVLTHKKKAGQKIVMLTAYDFPLAKLLDDSGIDIILVGDSLGNVALGYQNTLPVTMPEMMMHTQAVSRAAKRAMLVADMPFGSFQKDEKHALENAIDLVKAGAEAVKIEGAGYIDAIKKIIKAGIPVMGHLGFTPQSVHRLGYRVQGKGKRDKEKILSDARKLEKTGCFAVVLEMVPPKLARKVSKSVKIPVIGIGAGPHCDGQVLVTHDLLGLSERMPSFVKPKVDLKKAARKAVRSFISEVVSRKS